MEDWNKTWEDDRTVVLRRTSKRVKRLWTRYTWLSLSDWPVTSGTTTTMTTMTHVDDSLVEHHHTRTVQLWNEQTKHGQDTESFTGVMTLVKIMGSVQPGQWVKVWVHDVILIWSLWMLQKNSGSSWTRVCISIWLIYLLVPVTLGWRGDLKFWIDLDSQWCPCCRVLKWRPPQPFPLDQLCISWFHRGTYPWREKHVKMVVIQGGTCTLPHIHMYIPPYLNISFSNPRYLSCSVFTSTLWWNVSSFFMKRGALLEWNYHLCKQCFFFWLEYILCARNRRAQGKSTWSAHLP